MEKTISKTRHKTHNQKKAMIEALKMSLGVVSTAAKGVAITRKRHYEWLQRDAKYKAEVEEISEIAIDFAESHLFKKIKDGDTTATIFYLKTKGKKRGYIEKQEHEVRGEIGTISHMQIEFIPAPIAIAQDDFLSIEDIEHIKKLESKK